MGKYSIYIKNGFSERKGIKNFKDIVQVDSLNERTRNRLYSIIRDNFNSIVDYSYTNGAMYVMEEFIQYIYIEVFSLLEEDIPYDSIHERYSYYDILDDIKNVFVEYEYYDVFDFIETIFKYLKNNNDLVDKYELLVKSINKVFAEESVNYKIVDGVITDIITDEEIKTIEDAISEFNDSANNHLQKALELLYNSKDYENSIKESITAVEITCQKLLNNDKVTLGAALNKITKLHPALKEAYSKIYGYTSDANGIRHANGIGEGSTNQFEA